MFMSLVKLLPKCPTQQHLHLSLSVWLRFYTFSCKLDNLISRHYYCLCLLLVWGFEEYRAHLFDVYLSTHAQWVRNTCIYTRPWKRAHIRFPSTNKAFKGIYSIPCIRSSGILITCEMKIDDLKVRLHVVVFIKTFDCLYFDREKLYYKSFRSSKDDV